MGSILIAGGGPAGAAAAIAARMDGAPVRVLERAARNRHKVCGEFLSPGGREVLESLGAWDGVAALGPCRIGRCILHLGNLAKRWTFSESAWGASRLELDRLLLDRAEALGAVIARGEVADSHAPRAAEESFIMACGRGAPARGDRLFGFKTHFEGPCDDAVEVFFDRDGYLGVSGIENQVTNVCGIASESVLRAYGFDFDAVARRSRPIAERLSPLRRCMRWIAAGPLSFCAPARDARSGVYPAGDALGFVDPFTGSGIWNALLTGRLAGMAAARGVPSAEYLRACRKLLARPYAISSVLRRLAPIHAIHWLAPLVPGRVMFRWTRAGDFAGASAPAWSRS